MSTNSNSSSASQQETAEEKLFIALMREEWNNVVKIFGQHPMIHDKKMGNMMKATNERSADSSQYDEYLSDTVLHWAIGNEAPEYIVEKLVDVIVEAGNDKALETLRANNSRGDTPLHCAATRGSLAICQCMTRVDKSLVFERNREGETPLFLAALLGHQLVFLFLHSICKRRDPLLSSLIWKRTNGDTILHCTIRRKHFGQYTHNYAASFYN